jgi:hypothetical protein
MLTVLYPQLLSYVAELPVGLWPLEIKGEDRHGDSQERAII